MTRTKTPSVEIILPVYIARGDRTVEWLNQAITSVFEQSYDNWHLTLVDDGSPFDIEPLLAKWTSDYPRLISYMMNEGENGASKARMLAARHSARDIVMFLDQDDRYHPEKVARQVEFMQQHPSVSAVHTNIEIIDERGDPVDGVADRENQMRSDIDYLALSKQDLASSLFARNSIRIISGAFKRSDFMMIGGYDCELNGGEDWELWVRFADSYRIGHLGANLLQRRVHNGNTSKTQITTRAAGMIKAMEKMIQHHGYLQPLETDKRAQLEAKLNKLTHAA